MDPIAYAKYPFTQEASCYVKDRQYSIEDVIVKPAYEQVRTRAKRRVLDAIRGDAHPGDRLSDPERELLSYPVARIMVASTGDQYLIKRFALWESKYAYSLLLSESEAGLIAVGNDFSVNARVKDREFMLHFTDYLKYAAGLRNIGVEADQQEDYQRHGVCSQGCVRTVARGGGAGEGPGGPDRKGPGRYRHGAGTVHGRDQGGP